jgi:cytochrome c-type biogenesis protein CcmE
MNAGRRRSPAELLSSRRSRLILLMVVATASITVLAFYAAGPAMSHWVTPEELAARENIEGQRWRVGGRVVPDSIVESAGRPVRFEVQGESGLRTLVHYDGVVPGLFGPMAFVIVEGTATGRNEISGDNVIIRHEDEFFSEPPPEGSISSYFVPEDHPEVDPDSYDEYHGDPDGAPGNQE